jgi:hypothetical protein
MKALNQESIQNWKYLKKYKTVKFVFLMKYLGKILNFSNSKMIDRRSRFRLSHFWFIFLIIINKKVEITACGSKKQHAYK